MAGLENAAGATLLPSGMAAIAAVVESLTGAPPIVVAPHDGYGGARAYLRDLDEHGAIALRLVDTVDTDAVAAASAGAALLIIETISNPLLRVPDLPACIATAHAAGAEVLVDNTFATPLLCRPLDHGADLVVHSLTKYIGGHTDLVLGAVAARSAARLDRVRERRTLAGAIPGVLETWLALRGMRTLDVRFRRQCASALELARRLERTAGVLRVHHPGLPSHPQHDRAAQLLDGGFGAVVSLELLGGAERAEAFCQAVRLWTHTTSLGGVESTLERRARYAADAEVAPPSLVRLSVGIEDVDDLEADLVAALRTSGAA